MSDRVSGDEAVSPPDGLGRAALLLATESDAQVRLERLIGLVRADLAAADVVVARWDETGRKQVPVRSSEASELCPSSLATACGRVQAVGDMLDERGDAFQLALPLVSGGALVGALALERDRAFSAPERERLATFAVIVAASLVAEVGEELEALRIQARETCHRLNNALVLPSGVLEMIADRYDLPEHPRALLRSSAEALNEAVELVRRLQSVAWTTAPTEPSSLDGADQEVGWAEE